MPRAWYCVDCGKPCSRRAERCRSCREKFRWQDPNDPRRVPAHPIAPGHADWPDCECGCGELAPVRKATNNQRGFVKGEPCRFVAGHSSRSRRVGIVGGRKRCCRCREWKALDHFSSDKRRHCGLSPDCKSCVDERVAAWAAENKERIAASARRLRREKGPAYQREVMARWRERNYDHHLAVSRVSASAYRARKRGQFLEHVDAFVVLERHDGECHICGGDVDPFNFDVDHVDPLNNGGPHGYCNVRPAHPSCNSMKNDSLNWLLIVP